MSTLSQFFSSGGGGGIKSIQTGYVSSSTKAGTGEDYSFVNVTIAAVDPSKCVLQFFGYASATNYVHAVMPRLTSATNLRLSFSASAVGTIRGRWYVVEYN